MMMMMINKAAELFNWLGPKIFTFIIIWYATGLIAWITALFYFHFEYRDFRTGFHDGHEIIGFGPFALVFLVCVAIEQLKEKRMK
jgi:hypothetical protein